jgi:hypothetical protein
MFSKYAEGSGGTIEKTAAFKLRYLADHVGRGFSEVSVNAFSASRLIIQYFSLS